MNTLSYFIENYRNQIVTLFLLSLSAQEVKAVSGSCVWELGKDFYPHELSTTCNFLG